MRANLLIAHRKALLAVAWSKAGLIVCVFGLVESKNFWQSCEYKVFTHSTFLLK
jgi:hypothetical protein